MKGELFSQPFIMIFAILVGALILVFGVKSFIDIKGGAEDVELSKFAAILKNNIDTYYNFDVGSSKKLSLVMPAKAKEVCFYDDSKPVNIAADEFFQAVLEDTKDNMFILPLGSYFKTQFRIEHMKNGAGKNPFCVVKRDGKLNVIIETKAGLNDVFVEVKNE